MQQEKAMDSTTIMEQIVQDQDPSVDVVVDVDEHDDDIVVDDETQDPSSSTTCGRGQKRPLHEENSSELLLASTATRDLPSGVSIVWRDASSLVATLSVVNDGISDQATSESEEPSKTIQLCLVGRARIKCLQGRVELLGYSLTPDMEEISVSSPYWSSWLTMEVPVSQTTNTQLQISSIRGSPSFRLTNPIRPTIIPPSWRASVDQIGRDVSATPPPVRESLEENAPFVRSQDSIIMISGAKSVGKSTLMRYMTNRLLQLPAVSAVAILDADIGQPELAPPGMLTLSLRIQPLLHPPYWNLCDDTNKSEHTIQSIYFGAVTSKVDPTRYLESIQRLIQAYRDYMAQTTDRIPLIINLDGWIKGMGFQILSCLIDTTRPSYMCQIVGDSKAKTFDLSEVISTDDVDGAVQTQLFYLDVCNKFVSPFTIPSSSLRTLRLCAYFGPHLLDLWDSLDFLPAKRLQTGWSGDDECRLAQYLAQERPYCVPFEAVECVHSNTGMHMDLIHSLATQHARTTLIFQALNGSIVGLCTDGQEDCLGLGLVRSIDWDRRVLFILTPVSCDQLPRVKVLVGGNIPLPPPMVFRGVYAESFPYTTTTTATTTTSSGGGTTTNGPRNEGTMTQSYKILGSEPMKSRNNISRRSFAGTK